MIQKRSLRVPKGEQKTIRFDIACTLLFTDLSRKKIKSIIDLGGAYVNKKRVQIAKLEVKEDDLIELFWEEKQNSTPISAQDILFDNGEFIVLNKPAGIASQATLTSKNECVFYALNTLHPQKYKIPQLFLVHRLDKETSGVFLIARTPSLQKKFEDLFRLKKIQKEYEALCFYAPNSDRGEIDFPIAKDFSRPNCYYAVLKKGEKPQDSKSAITKYEVLTRFKSQCSQIRLFPETGRTHQIRVHLAAVGCPILGDKTYAQNIYGHPYGQRALRHMLHAARISFSLEGKEYSFEAPFPKDYVELRDQFMGEGK
jgi:23S rRNA pseudouridine1911/1915/1917 synthase